MFAGCRDLSIETNDVPNFKFVADSGYMFAETSHVKIPSNIWDNTSNISFYRMFYKAEGISESTVNWNTSHVTSMEGMFFRVPFNLPIGNWDTSNVRTMRKMFADSTFNQPIEKWNTSNVIDMSYMFADSTFNQPIENWDTSNVTDFIEMFANAKNFNQSLKKWNLCKRLAEDEVDLTGMFQFLENYKDWAFSSDCVITEDAQKLLRYIYGSDGEYDD